MNIFGYQSFTYINWSTQEFILFYLFTLIYFKITETKTEIIIK